MPSPEIIENRRSDEVWPISCKRHPRSRNLSRRRATPKSSKLVDVSESGRDVTRVTLGAGIWYRSRPVPQSWEITDQNESGRGFARGTPQAALWPRSLPKIIENHRSERVWQMSRERRPRSRNVAQDLRVKTSKIIRVRVSREAPHKQESGPGAAQS